VRCPTVAALASRRLAYHALVPSFGEWGYVLASRQKLHVPSQAPAGLRYLNDAVVASMFAFSPGLWRPVPVEVNRTQQSGAGALYDEEWRQTM